MYMYVNVVLYYPHMYKYIEINYTVDNYKLEYMYKPSICPLYYSGIALLLLSPILPDTLAPSYSVLYFQFQSSTSIFIQALCFIFHFILIKSNIEWSDRKEEREERERERERERMGERVRERERGGEGERGWERE